MLQCSLYVHKYFDLLTWSVLSSSRSWPLPTCLYPQVNGVVHGAALMFQNLQNVVLRRAAHLRDFALMALAHANGPRLKVRQGSHCVDL